MRDRKLGFIIFTIILGALIGSVLGEVIGLMLPEGVVKDLFIRSVEPGAGPLTLNLLVMTLTVGLTLKLNFVSLIGIIIAAYLLKWYR